MGRTVPLPGLDMKLSVDVLRDQQPHHEARIDAHVRVEAVGVGPRDETPAVEIAVIIAVDATEVRRDATESALAAALRALPDGISFTVLGGAPADGPGPSRCYPLRGRWALADGAERRRAAFSAGRIAPAAGGNPPIGYATWLATARELFAERVLPVRHLLLITDGSSRDDEDDAFRENSGLLAELAACEGAFTADVLAVGSDWDPGALLAVAERLHGAAESVPDRFGPVVSGALRRLRRVRSPELPVEVTLRPAVLAAELTETAPRQQPLDAVYRPDRVDFLTHQWEPGVRDYLLALRVDASTDPLGVPLQLATVSVGGATSPVVVRWLPPGAAAGPPGGGGGTVQAVNDTTRMRTALKRGYAALDPLNRGEAEQQLGLAVRLADEMGVQWVLEGIREVVEIVDARQGRVRVGPTVDPASVRQGQLHIASGHMVELPEGPAGRPVHCPDPDCRYPAGSHARFCIKCGREL
ncbi:hypothetical protein ABZ826_14845 [Streptomyces sp. NPDC047515]|uniref:hypothetical protein n=1 Tax=Streptomyces sp. NPDC047515 TaxID=3155380 RepID=UPI0033DD657C